jgi:hypothetical protein
MDTPCVSNIEPDPVILDMDFRMFVWHESHMGVQRPYKPVTQSAKVVRLRGCVLFDVNIYDSMGFVKRPVVNTVILFTDEAFRTALRDVNAFDGPEPEKITLLQDFQSHVHGRDHKFARYHCTSSLMSGQ